MLMIVLHKLHDQPVGNIQLVQINLDNFEDPPVIQVHFINFITILIKLTSKYFFSFEE